MKKGDTYKCASCGGTFECAWDDLKEAVQEFKKNFSPEMRAKPFSIVCDDCYKGMMKLWKELKTKGEP